MGIEWAGRTRDAGAGSAWIVYNFETMNRKNNFRILILFFAVLSSPLPVEAADTRTGTMISQASVQGVLEEINQLRMENNLTPYEPHPILMEVAQAHAESLAARGFVTHYGADGSRPYERALQAGYSVGGDLSTGGDLAENVHSGADLTPEKLVIIWNGDAVTRETLLSENYADIGIGEASATGITYHVVMAGLEGEASPTAVPPEGGQEAPVTLEFVIATAGGFGTPAIVVLKSTPQASGEVFHVVKKNEGLWNIALAYGITLDEIKKLNGLSGDEIFEGQRLLVARPEPTSTPTLTPEVTVTLGIPTSTATLPVTPSITHTSTPVPTAPASRQNSERVVGGIFLAALAAGILGAWLGKRKDPASVD